MSNSPTVDDARQVAQLVVDAVAPLRVILFGSLARGEETPGDIDLMVVMPDGTNRLRIAQDLHELVGDHPEIDAAVDFVVVTPAVLARFNKSVVSAYPVILQEGRELYGAA